MFHAHQHAPSKIFQPVNGARSDKLHFINLEHGVRLAGECAPCFGSFAKADIGKESCNSVVDALASTLSRLGARRYTCYGSVAVLGLCMYLCMCMQRRRFGLKEEEGKRVAV